ncbi:damage-inducible protein DinB [Paenibacillus sp. IHB B 3084]|uniref:DinB family protein n=1 Tax=Paenibacillus sp. IHB B 3084 TaxID=867076 RepID=UPI00072260A3|nr:DinB family protein [Paenibacillus sp. IHB B 3084]ALP35996.1 damage-inducible protein DinB [Paenibacillus sp. IHB B 3084]
MTDFSLQFYDFNVWANEQIFKRLKELPKDAYRQEVQSVFSSLSNVLAHVYLSDLGWIEVFSGKSMNHALTLAEQLKEQTESKGLEEMETMFFELSERFKSFLNQKGNIDKPLVIENPSADLMKTRVSEIVPHIVNHGTYHRGNISAMLRQMGYASVSTDYGLFLYLKTRV